MKGGGRGREELWRLSVLAELLAYCSCRFACSGRCKGHTDHQLLYSSKKGLTRTSTVCLVGELKRRRWLVMGVVVVSVSVATGM